MNKSKYKIQWVEKYRPRSWKDIVLEHSTMERLKRIDNSKNMPNLLIAGPPGTGKTTTAYCCARALLGEHCDDATLKLNGSDERGTKIVKQVISHFCKKRTNVDKKKWAKHKIIIIDEVDNMTAKAQQMISNLMREYHNTTRFIFLCNDSSKILEAIQSNCIILRYKRLCSENMKNRLKYICKEEKLYYSKDGLEALIMTTEGDMRKAINNLQLISNGIGSVTVKSVYDLCDTPNMIEIKNIINHCGSGNVVKALKSVQNMYDKGYSTLDISLGLFSCIKIGEQLDISNDLQYLYADFISKTCMVVSEGITTELQIIACICRMAEMT